VEPRRSEVFGKDGLSSSFHSASLGKICVWCEMPVDKGDNGVPHTSTPGPLGTSYDLCYSLSFSPALSPCFSEASSCAAATAELFSVQADTYV